MKTQSKTVFIEYSSFNKGQHFMTVIQVTDGQRQIIGRIFREYDNEKMKTNYRAVDWAGNPVFFDIKDLSTLKKKFTEHGKSLAELTHMSKGRNLTKSRTKGPSYKNLLKKNEEKQVKEEKPEKKLQEQEIKRGGKKTKEQEQEKLQPKPDMYERDKELNQIRHPESTPEVEQNRETDDNPEISDRDLELEEIRDAHEEREQEQNLDQEQEMDR